VELSIVLVILGLLVGGVLTGKSLIRAAELRSVVTEATAYQTAIYSFKDKYGALPGDMNNAERFWGTDPDGCPTHTNRVQKATTCNGNGDGSLPVNSPESFRAWQHLANAGLITGSYTGVAGSAGVQDYDFGENAPTSKIANAGWGFLSYDNTTLLNGFYFQQNYQNALQIGISDNVYPDGEFLITEEAWSIDKKIDDGRPAYGKVISNLICSNASSITDFAAEYALSATGALCSLWVLP
jgi:hypothetical protein